MTITFISNVASSNPDLPQAERDDLLIGTTSGIDLFDISHPYSYRSSTDAVSGQVVYNLARNQDNLVVQLPAGSTADLLGGGIVFETTVSGFAGVKMPADIQADLFANQEYLVCVYIKIPTTAEWPTSNNRFIGDSAVANDSMVQGYFSNVVGQFVARRITASGGAGEQRTYIIPEEHRGKVAQISIYRTSTSWGFVINCDGLSFGSSQASGSNSTYDWSSKSMIFGATAVNNPIQVYRGFIENIHNTGRDPIAVISADWLRIKNLGVFS